MHSVAFEEARVVRKQVLVVVLILVGGVVGAPAHARAGRADIDGVRGWNELSLNAVRATRATDADAARLYTMVNVAI